MKEYSISWLTKDYEMIKSIMAYFGMKGMTVNKRTKCFIPDAMIEKFFEGERKGFYYIHNK